MSLPLPRFAYDLPMICRKSATSSPIVVKTSTPADSVRIKNKMDESPVSPGLIFSPDFSKSDSMVFADPMESAEIEPVKVDLLKTDDEVAKLHSTPAVVFCSEADKESAAIDQVSNSTETVEEAKNVEEPKVEIVEAVTKDSVPSTKESVQLTASASVSVPASNDSLNVTMDMELDNSVVDSVGFSPTVDVKDKIEADILAKEVAETESVKEESCLDKDLNDADMSSKMAACDSDTGDLLSPTLLVFDERIDERIKALDEQLNRMNQGVKSMPSSASTITPPPPVSEITPAVNDYRLKYSRRRRDASLLSSMNMESRNEPSEVAKSLLTRSSIFDQDTKRLENLQTKYEPVGGLYASQSMIGTPVHSSLHGSGDGIGITGVVPFDKPIQATMPYSNLSGWGQSIVPSGSSGWNQTMVPGAQLMNTNYPTIVGQPAQQSYYAIPQNSWNQGVPSYCVRPTSVDYGAGSNRTHHNLTLDVSRQPLPPSNSITLPYSSSTPSSSSLYPQPFSGISSADPRRLSRPDYNTTWDGFSGNTQAFRCSTSGARVVEPISESRATHAAQFDEV